MGGGGQGDRGALHPIFPLFPPVYHGSRGVQRDLGLEAVRLRTPIYSGEQGEQKD